VHAALRVRELDRERVARRLCQLSRRTALSVRSGFVIRIDGGRPARQHGATDIDLAFHGDR